MEAGRRNQATAMHVAEENSALAAQRARAAVLNAIDEWYRAHEGRQFPWHRRARRNGWR